MDEVQKIEGALRARGVRVVGVTWSPMAGAVPKEKRTSDLVKFFDAILAGRHHPAPPIGDSHGQKA